MVLFPKNALFIDAGQVVGEVLEGIFVTIVTLTIFREITGLSSFVHLRITLRSLKLCSVPYRTMLRSMQSIAL